MGEEPPRGVRRGALRVRLADGFQIANGIPMSNRQMVIDLLERLPEDAPLEEMAREVEFLAGIQTARDQARRGQGMAPEEVLKQVDEWVAE